MGSVIFVEGLPGSGKSTRLHDLRKNLGQQYHCICYQEETSQPLDLFRQAVLREDIFLKLRDKVISEYPESIEEMERWIRENSYRLREDRILAYTQIKKKSPCLIKLASLLKQYDMGDGRSSFSLYEHQHRLLWQTFAREIYDHKNVYLSEGALFHNQLFDLIGFYELEEEEILHYYQGLVKELRGIPCLVEYIDVPNISVLIDETNSVREGWQEQLQIWLLHAPWAVKRNYLGKRGVIKLYEKIRIIHKMLLREIGISVSVTRRE